MSIMYTMSTSASPPAAPTLTIPLTAHHIRFTCRAVTPIHFHDFMGSALRGAFTTVIRRTFCPQWRAEETDPLHQALCPICQLLNAENTDENGGDVRRPYAVEPPLDDRRDLAPGEPFTFGMTLYGDKIGYLPYLVLTVGGMGEAGVGQKGETGERGKFVVEQIDALNPLTGELLLMMGPEERLVRAETLPVTHEQVLESAERLLAALAAHDNCLHIDFLTPTRLITQGEHTAKQPDFFPLIKQVVLRVLDLCAQHGGGRPAVVLKQDLYPYADQVELVADQTHWWDVKGYSSRLGQSQVLGGFVGSAIYRAPDWRPLLPWLLWGQSTHVGKNVVKGCGVYRIAPRYSQPERKEQWLESNI